MLPRMHRCKRVSGRRQGDLMTDENAGEKGKSNIRRRKEERKEESKRVTKGFWDLREKRHKRRRKGEKAFLEPTRRSGHGAW